MEPVTCFGGPHDGRVVTLTRETLGWEVWRPVLLENGFWKEYMGSYIIESRKDRAFWVEACRGTL
jgi:hypothetical protein